jgi:hypothetical protein
MDLKKRAPFVVPLAITICVHPHVQLAGAHRVTTGLLPPDRGRRLTYALGLIISSGPSPRIRLRGTRSYLSHLKEPYVFLAPINVLEG